MDVNLTQIKIN